MPPPGRALAPLVSRNATIGLIREDARQEAGEGVITDTAAFDAVTDLMDEVQRGNQMLARLCEKAGIDVAEARRLPGEVPSPARAA